jgi:hypothetical protein
MYEHHDVRTTLTLDDDVAALLKKKARSSGEPFKTAVNHAIRLGLAAEQNAKNLPRFKVRARKIGVPEEWFEGSTQDLFDKLDGPFSR